MNQDILIQIYVSFFIFLIIFLYNRCGQRTVLGILKDGFNALMRYYLNNFADGTKQVCILSLLISIVLQSY